MIDINFWLLWILTYLLVHYVYTVNSNYRHVKPDKVKLGQLELIPQQGSVDVIYWADKVDQGVSGQLGQHRLALVIPQRGAINVVDEKVDVVLNIVNNVLDMVG